MITSVTRMLNNVTSPKNVGSHFPADLNTANQVTNDVIDILRENIMEAVPLNLNVVSILQQRTQLWNTHVLTCICMALIHSLLSPRKWFKCLTICSMMVTLRDGGSPKL